MSIKARGDGKLWWLGLAGASAVAYGLGSVATDQLIKRSKYSATAVTTSYHLVGVWMFLLAIIVGLPFGLGTDAWKDLRRAFTTRDFGFILAIAIAFFIGDIASAQAYHTAPNVGYCVAIQDLYIIPTTLLPVVFFGAQLGLRQGAGIALALIALYLIAR